MSRARGLAALCLCLSAALLLAPAAGAEWRTVPSPAGQIRDLVAADADTWLVEPQPTCCTPSFHVTGDGGAGWSTVQVPGYDFARSVGAATDGSFRVLAWTSSVKDPREARLFRIAGESVEPLGPAIETETTFFNQTAAVSADGVTWVPYLDGAANHRLAVIGADGSSSVLTPPAGPTPTTEWKAQRTGLGLRLLRFAPEGPVPSAFARETFRLDGGSLVPAEAQPVDYIDGELWMGGSGAISWDGGAHWSYSRGGSLVPRAPGLGMPRYMTLPGGGIAASFSPALFRRTGLDWPAGVPINFVVDAGPLIAWDGAAIHVHAGLLPPPPTAIGALEPDTRALVERANLFRADAGLPPLIGDALVSQASRNHSRYTMLNANSPGPEIGHDELTGRPGFTGVTPWARCEAVGTECGGEIMHSDQVDPVADWLATPFHRPLLASPAGGIVGAGQVEGGWAVMNSKSQEQSVLVRPFGYPNGRWRGREGFAGERPDPVKACQAGGQPVEYPVGIAVTLFIPADFVQDDAKVTRIEVRARGTSAALAGCLLEDSDFYGLGTTGIFLLDDPLLPGTTYDVRGVWETPSALGGFEDKIPGTQTTLAHEWSFAFQPDGYGQRRRVRRCQAVKLRRIGARTALRRGKRRGAKKGLRVRLRLSHPARARLRRAVLILPGKGKRRRARLPLGRLRKRDVRVGRRSVLTLRLRRRLARRLPAGEKVRLRLTFRAQRRRGCARRATFSRRLGARVGWVRLKAPASWRSPKKAKRRSRGG